MPKEHNVNVKISERKKIEYDTHCVHAWRGDTITWKLDKPRPFAIVIKAFDSPLEWSFAVVSRGKRALVGTVRADAAPGFYSYGVCVVEGGELLVDDPEIIVRPPRKP
jgi:hypothetical protein